MEKTTRAMIYIRGEAEAQQELFCMMYALERDYEVVGVVKSIEEVKDCDVLIVINASRISRKTEEYYTKINEFKKRGIEVEIAGTEENAGRFIELITRDLHKKKKWANRIAHVEILHGLFFTTLVME